MRTKELLIHYYTLEMEHKSVTAFLALPFAKGFKFLIISCNLRIHFTAKLISSEDADTETRCINELNCNEDTYSCHVIYK